MSAHMTPFNPAELLRSDEEIAAYLAEVNEREPREIFLAALGNVVQIRGVGRVARRAGVPEDRLRAIVAGEAEPTADEVRAVLHALDVRLEGAA